MIRSVKKPLARGGGKSTPAWVAGSSTVAEHAGNWATTHRKDGKTRRTIRDMCDFCKAFGYVKREHMQFRLKGYKFGCGDCLKSGIWKAKKDGGDGKVFLCTKYPAGQAD